LNFIDEFLTDRMGLFSFLRKNKQESASDDNAFYSRAEEAPGATRGRGKRRQGKQAAQSDASDDPVLPEKKRARRRLIGAVALVLAAVIGLPMILDSEPKPLADDIAIQIPSKDKLLPPPLNARPGNPPAASRIAASASLDPKEEVIAPPAPDAMQAGTKMTQPILEAAAVSPANDEAAKEDKPVVKPAKPAKETKAVTADKTDHTALASAKPDIKTKTVEKNDDAARARALLEGKSDPLAAEKKPAKFVIQVAALATKEKIDELQGKLKSAGIKSYTQKVATASGDRTRIRVGPFASKEDAEKMRARIVKLGLNGTLVPA
jgi:DedD protein